MRQLQIHQFSQILADCFLNINRIISKVFPDRLNSLEKFDYFRYTDLYLHGRFSFGLIWQDQYLFIGETPFLVTL